MDTQTLIVLCGLHSLGFALFHLAFWKLFDWPRSLHAAGVANRAIIQIANLRLVYVFLGVATLCFVFPQQLVGTPLGRALLLGMSGFWIGRAIEQFVFLRIGKTMVHVLTASFVLGAVLFAMPLFY
ncbi:MAG: hypothetical protein LC715_01115 [Gammaproteobacteria bacterium]|nr:hypothetical protein [Gammaproteobacteria bacterium]